MERHGFIRSELELKTLILFALKCAATPVAFEHLSDMVLHDEAIDYFEYVNALNDLVKTEHIYREAKPEAELYFISKKGLKNLEVYVGNLPVSVRKHTEKAVDTILRSLRREADISAQITARENGTFSVICKLRDDSGELLSMELTAFTDEQARALAAGFKDKAEKIYNVLLSEML